MWEWISFLAWGFLYLIIIAFVISLLIARRPKKLGDCKGKHVLITGGSTGLGKSLAIKFAKLGANVTIIARNEQKLKETQKDINAQCASSTQKVVAIAADVTKFTEIDSAIKRAIKENGVTDYVIANAGSSTPGYFLEQSIETLEKEVQLNYLGLVYTVKSALPFMVERDQGGHFIFVSSAAAFANFIGYTNYGATKRAVAAFAEGLRNEMQLYGIDVSVYFPTGIDTDGFQNENKTKPEETKIIEGSSSTLSPDSVAQSLMDGLQSGKFAITNEFLTELMRVGANGTFSPRHNNIVDLALSLVLLMICNPILFYFDWVVARKRKAKSS